MIDGHRVLALVPARSGSKGLPGKNIRRLGGKPLLAWPIAAARAAHCVDRVLLSTDDAHYAQLGVEAGAEAPFLRPAALATDTSPSIDFMLHALDWLEAQGESYDYLVLLEPTSPLTSGVDVDAALQRLHAQRDIADAIVGVHALTTSHPAFAVRVDARGLAQPYAAESFGALARRQDLEPLYALDGSLYVSDVEALRRERGFCHARTLAFPMPRHKSLEIDDLLDFTCIEAVLAQPGFTTEYTK